MGIRVPDWRAEPDPEMKPRSHSGEVFGLLTMHNAGHDPDHRWRLARLPGMASGLLRHT